MTLTVSDQPLDLACGIVDQAWLDRINDWRNRTFSEILALQTGLGGNSYDFQSLQDQLDALTLAIPSMICNEISPRFFTGSDSGSGTLSVILPAGGTWRTVVTYDGGQGANAVGGGFPSWIFVVDDDDQGLGGSIAEVRPGGYIYSIGQGGADAGVLSIFAYRENC